MSSSSLHKVVIAPDSATPITLETGQLARQADGSVVLRQGKLMLLATVCAGKEPKEGQSFFPLSVDYMEKFSAAGRIPGSFHKREGKLSDYEVLISRLIDRALRPLFPEDYLCDVQVMVTLLSSDEDILPDALAGLAASAALAVSDIPLSALISEVRVAKINGRYEINPGRSALKTATMDFIVAASEKNLLMVEGEARECSEEELLEALAVAHQAIRTQIEAQKTLRAQVGITQHRSYPQPEQNEALRTAINAFAGDKIRQIAASALSKTERNQEWTTLKDALLQHLEAAHSVHLETHAHLVDKYFDDCQWDLVREVILTQKIRLDGRDFTTVRPLQMAVDYLPSPHGSALFTRGETQSLSTVTLATSLSDLLLETAHHSEYSKFILHYNFPGYSTGEVKPNRGPGRREVGHGNLALRSLKQMMPSEQDNPYTIRIVSDILESNGSSSMATVCAGSLALMDAGIQLKKHVGGIAMGLITKGADHAILTDILGDEDHLGDMDFKITGTREGICGVQMDIKIDGLSIELMRAALDQAKAARLHILDAMYAAIAAPRNIPKPQTPRIEKIIIDKDLIGAVIGPQGKVVQDIQKKSGATVTIEEKEEKGAITIFAPKTEQLNIAVSMIKALVTVPEVGKEYNAIVKSIQPYGAFVEFLPKYQGLLHISEISHEHIQNVEDILKEGQEIKVKLLAIDPKTGKYRLSHKVFISK